MRCAPISGFFAAPGQGIFPDRGRDIFRPSTQFIRRRREPAPIGFMPLVVIAPWDEAVGAETPARGAFLGVRAAIDRTLFFGGISFCQNGAGLPDEAAGAVFRVRASY
jgi:hypothetical protein